ncbi:UDP-N-acetylmuramate dehydrogenase [bacterium]|nr:UDP-N-acetylmuramate dehydrogenase [bacterium]
METQAMSDWKEEILKRWVKPEKNNFTLSDELRDKLLTCFKGDIKFNEPMNEHTSIRIGGKADVFLKPSGVDDIVAIFKLAREQTLPLTLFGSGSNTLVKDKGIRGLVVSVVGVLNQFEVLSQNENNADVQVGAGLGITAFVNKCAEVRLTGMEALVGIPGSMGGAMAMNAGARGVEIADIIREICILTEEGEVKTISREKLDFSYRKLKLPKNTMILSGIFRLNVGAQEDIEKSILEFKKKRVDTQPLNYPNFGSVFKNPEPAKPGKKAVHAAVLIEESGLKGIRVGGARVSDKHANFIINERDATAKDVMVLMNLVRDKVKEKTGVVLDPEVKVIGE